MRNRFYSEYRELWPVLLLILTLLPVSASTAAEAGRFLFVFGKVEVQSSEGQWQQAKKGMLLNEGTTIRSDKTGKAQIRLIDGGFFAVRPNTTLRIDEYAYDSADSANSKGVVSLIKGTFRSISGAIGRDSPDNVVVKTPVATIGIRGTDHEPFYIPPDEAGLPADMPPGVYDKVNSGATVISNETGSLVVSAGQVGFVSTPQAQPALLPQLPAFYQQPDGPDGDEETSEEEDAGSEESGDDASASSDSAGTAEDTAQDGGVATGETSSGETGGSTAPLTTETAGNSTPVDMLDEPVVASDASGNTVNFDNQQVTASDGTVTGFSDTTAVFTARAAHVAFIKFDETAGVGSNNSDLKMIEDSEFIDGVRDTILRDLSGHVYGATDDEGDHVISGINADSKVTGQANDFANNGITFGMYTANNLNDAGRIHPLGNRYVGWIIGPAYQASGLSGTVGFSLAGGLAYSGPLTGSWSPLAYNGASQLTMNFGTQRANMIIDVGPAGNRWVFNASNLPLVTAGEFNFDAASAVKSMTYNGDNSLVYFDISGGLSGQDSGAMFSFAAKKVIENSDGRGISGVVAFDR